MKTVLTLMVVVFWGVLVIYSLMANGRSSAVEMKPHPDDGQSVLRTADTTIFLTRIATACAGVLLWLIWN